MNQGTKSPSADLIILNSASQTFVKLAAIIFGLRRLSKTFSLSLPGLLTRNFHQFTRITAAVKNFFQLSFAARISLSQRTMQDENTTGQSLRKRFFDFSDFSFRPPKTEGVSAQEAAGEDGVGSQQFGQDPAVEGNGGIALLHFPQDFRKCLDFSMLQRKTGEQGVVYGAQAVPRLP